MTLTRQILTSKQKDLIFTSDDPLVEEYFSNPSNYADSNLTQFNTDRVYDAILVGGENLTILDLGANAGFFTLYAQDRARMIYAVEPTPSHFHILKELTTSYRNVVRCNLALHDKDENVEFFIKPDNSTMNSTAIKYGVAETVQGMTLKTLLSSIGETNIDFVKCDIEGSEMIALTDETVGAVRDQIKVWFVEVHATNHDHWEESMQLNRSLLATMFVRQGYQVQTFRRDILYAYK